MFQALPQGSRIEVVPNHIVGLHRSLNSPVIALGGGAPVQCRAHILGAYNAHGTYTLFVVLSPPGRSQPLLFRSEPVSIPIAEYRNSELSALELVKRYGFVMERIDLSALSEGDRARLMRELPLAAPSEEEVVLRLLDEPPRGAQKMASASPSPRTASSPISAGMDSDSPLDLAEAGAPVPTVTVAARSGGADLGIAPEEAIAVLGRLLAGF